MSADVAVAELPRLLRVNPVRNKEIPDSVQASIYPRQECAVFMEIVFQKHFLLFPPASFTFAIFYQLLAGQNQVGMKVPHIKKSTTAIQTIFASFRFFSAAGVPMPRQDSSSPSYLACCGKIQKTNLELSW